MNKSNDTSNAFIGLMLFVGIPLPGTGAWTGALNLLLCGNGYQESITCYILRYLDSNSDCIGFILWFIIRSLNLLTEAFFFKRD